MSPTAKDVSRTSIHRARDQEGANGGILSNQPRFDD